MDWLLWAVAAIVLLFCIVVVRGAPYVPSHKKYVEKSLTSLYKLTKKDLLVDLGSGDGVVLRTASRLGARSIGYELNPLLAMIARFLSRKDTNVTVKVADFWLIDLPHDTTIVYIFSVSRDAKKLEQKMQQWTDDKGEDLLLMTYGPSLKTKQPEKILDGHALYRFQANALQRPQA